MAQKYTGIPFDPTNRRHIRVIDYWKRQDPQHVRCQRFIAGQVPSVILSDGSVWPVIAEHEAAKKRFKRLHPPGDGQARLF